MSLLREAEEVLGEAEELGTQLAAPQPLPAAAPPAGRGRREPLRTDWCAALAPPTAGGPPVPRLPRMQSFTVDLLPKCVFYLM